MSLTLHCISLSTFVNLYVYVSVCDLWLRISPVDKMLSSHRTHLPVDYAGESRNIWKIVRGEKGRERERERVRKRVWERERERGRNGHRNRIIETNIQTVVCNYRVFTFNSASWNNGDWASHNDNRNEKFNKTL